VNHIAWLEPSKALLDLCPYRPMPGKMVCLTRVHSTIKNNVLNRNLKDVVEIRPGEESSVTEMKGLMGQVMLQGGTSGFTDTLGKNFSDQLINKLSLNNRYRKAYVLNPLVDWSYQAMQEAQPRSTAFTVCTKIIVIGLITINSGTGTQLARRLLSSTMDLSPESNLAVYNSGWDSSSPYLHSGRALLQVLPSNSLNPTPTQSGNSLFLNMEIPGYDSVTHLCNIMLGVPYNNCNVLQFNNLLSGSKALQLCSANANGVLGDTLSNTFSNTLKDPSGLSQITGVFVLDYTLIGCENLLSAVSASTNTPSADRRLLQSDPFMGFIVSMKTNLLIGSLNGTSILSLDRMDELGKWLNSTIFPNIVAGGGFVTSVELKFIPGEKGQPGKVQVVVGLGGNASSVNKTHIQDKIKEIYGDRDVEFLDTSILKGSKSSADRLTSSSSWAKYLILVINTITLSAMISVMGYIK
jgi:hypothetical protein